MKEEEIRFYRVNEENGYLSNFAATPIFLDGQIWPTVEHFYQASKFDAQELRQQIRKMPTPLLAAQAGRDDKNIPVAEWHVKRVKVMKDALLAKFKQHPTLLAALINTGDAVIIEHTKNDSYWGNNGDGTGENMLGKLLMEVRLELKESLAVPTIPLPPWKSFPSLSPIDMFWRMGRGESYLTRWVKAFSEASNIEQESYMLTYPEPNDWIGFYDE